VIICHKIDWKDCLSHEIYKAIYAGWQDDETKVIHFFWGLGGNNVPQIMELEKSGSEWWFIDTGYITKQIQRYPVPKILDYDKTYFRICKGSIHSKLKPSTSNRYKELEIPQQENYYNKDGHILVTPSSPTVTRFVNGESQEAWSLKALDYANPHGVFRNKPRPGNKWYGIDIKEQLKGARALITNMSLSAIDAALLGIPIITDSQHVCSSIASDNINSLQVPSLTNWIASVADNQFTLDEIRKGIAYDCLT
jgi:hypothetical protein